MFQQTHGGNAIILSMSTSGLTSAQHSANGSTEAPGHPVVFTDLDATLLDHDTYSWRAAEPALTRLRELRIPVVLTSSKTAAEIRNLQQDIGLIGTPAIVENGAGTVGIPTSGIGPDAQYHLLRARLNEVPDALRQCFKGFGDDSDEGVAEHTGLALSAAKLARQREFTEPGLWSGTDQQLHAFLHELTQRDVSVRQGGRYLTLSFGRTKADAMRDVMTHLGAQFSIALGDAPNDVEMLESADIGIVIANPYRDALPKLDGEKEGRVRRSIEAGPAGWNRAMLDVLLELGLYRH